MSSKNNSEFWTCPLGIKKLPYGTSCQDPRLCDDEFNSNARHYVNLETRERLNLKKGIGTGISEIANQEEKEE